MLDHVGRDPDGFWPQMRSRTHMSTCAFYDIETGLSDLAVGDSWEHFDTCKSPSVWVCKSKAYNYIYMSAPNETCITFASLTGTLQESVSWGASSVGCKFASCMSFCHLTAPSLVIPELTRWYGDCELSTTKHCPREISHAKPLTTSPTFANESKTAL